MKETKVLRTEHKFAAVSSDGNEILNIGRNLKGFSKEKTAQENLEDHIRFAKVRLEWSTYPGDKEFISKLESAKVVEIEVSYKITSKD